MLHIATQCLDTGSTDNLNTLMIGSSSALVTQTEIMGLLVISWTPIKFSHSGDNLHYMTVGLGDFGVRMWATNPSEYRLLLPLLGGFCCAPRQTDALGEFILKHKLPD